MKLGRTGHAEIDEQHLILEEMIETLSSFCSYKSEEDLCVCKSCKIKGQQQCLIELLEFLKNLVDFIRGHSSYEEKLMELLPQTEACKSHVITHKESHALVLSKLQKLLNISGCYEPKTILLKTLPIVSEWVAHHTPTFDAFLVSKLDESIPEGGFDSQLVSMLDNHVFPLRPRKLAQNVGLAKQLQNIHTCVVKNYKSLTPTQRRIFWLVISGNTSNSIASTLKISVNTVKSHRTAIYQKMNVNSVHELRDKADLVRK